MIIRQLSDRPDHYTDWYCVYCPLRLTNPRAANMLS